MMENEQQTMFIRELMMRIPYGVMVRDCSGLEPRTFKPTGVNLTGGCLEWYDFANHCMRHSQFDQCKMVLKPAAFLIEENGNDGLYPLVRYAIQQHSKIYGTECQWRKPYGKELVITFDREGNCKYHFLMSILNLTNLRWPKVMEDLQFLCQNHVDFMGSVKQGFAVYEDGMENMPDLLEKRDTKLVNVDIGESYEEKI